MKKNLIILVFLFSSSVVVAEETTYYCSTNQISTTQKDLVEGNYENITFSFTLEGTIVGEEVGEVSFSDNAISNGLINTLGLGNSLFIETHVNKEQFMASLGSGSKAWFHEGNLAISSFYQDENSNVKLIVNSLSTCLK
tara:strand:+ start:17 stop:433 length:417 start_codon:yes stop_codon:yes gene_type:complete